MNTSRKSAHCFLLGLVCLLWAAAPVPARDDGGSGARDGAEASQKASRDKDDARDRDQDDDKHKRDRRDRKDPPFGGITADELDQEDIQEVLGVLNKANPQMAQRLENLRGQSESEFRKAVAKVASSRRIRWLMMQKRFDPKGFKLRAAEYRLQHHMDNVTDRLEASDKGSEEAKSLKSELRSLLSEAFEVRQKLREHELARLERRIEHLRSELEEKRQRKEEMIERRYQEILHDPDEGRHGFGKRRGKGRPGPPGRKKKKHRDDD